MSKKHFNRIAAALLASRPDDKTGVAYQQWRFDVKQMADVCGEFNSLFDYPYFIAACGASS